MLQPGLFLLLGFSHKEQEIMKSVIKAGAVGAMTPLQKLVRRISEEMGVSTRFL